MPAPECTCIVELDLYRKQGRVLFCPLHEAAGDLYTALEAILEGERAPIFSPESLAQAKSRWEAAMAALLKANPQRTKDDE